MPRSAMQPAGEPGPVAPDLFSATVYSGERTIEAPAIDLPPDLKPNTRLRMDGLEFLSKIPSGVIPVAFLDPQYRGVLDKLAYGNEGKQRGQKRAALMQMPDDVIGRFIRGIDRVLIPSGHLFLWVDKFHLCQGIGPWLENTGLDIVDLVTWDKGTFGMGIEHGGGANTASCCSRNPARQRECGSPTTSPMSCVRRLHRRAIPMPSRWASRVTCCPPSPTRATS